MMLTEPTARLLWYQHYPACRICGRGEGCQCPDREWRSRFTCEIDQGRQSGLVLVAWSAFEDSRFDLGPIRVLGINRDADSRKCFYAARKDGWYRISWYWHALRLWFLRSTWPLRWRAYAALESVGVLEIPEGERPSMAAHHRWWKGARDDEQ